MLQLALQSYRREKKSVIKLRVVGRKKKTKNHLEFGIRSFLTPIFKPPDMLTLSVPDTIFVRNET